MTAREPGYLKFLRSIQRPPTSGISREGREVDLIPFDDETDALAIIAACSFLPKRSVRSAGHIRNEAIQIQTPTGHLTLTREAGVLLVDRATQAVDVITRADYVQHYAQEGKP